MTTFKDGWPPLDLQGWGDRYLIIAGPQVSGQWSGGAYLLEVRVQLFQHYFQLVHLACQIQGWLLAGKTGDRVRLLSLLRFWGILSLLVSQQGLEE